MSLSALCVFDLDLPLQLEVFDYNDGVKFSLIGATITSVRELIAVDGRPFELIKESKRLKSRKYQNSGLLCAEVRIEHAPSFTDVRSIHKPLSMQHGLQCVTPLICLFACLRHSSCRVDASCR